MQKIIYALLAGLVLGFMAGWTVKGWAVGASLTAGYEKLLGARVAGEQKTATLEAKTDQTLSNDRAADRAAAKKVEVSRAKNPTGYSCIVPADGLQQLHERIGATTRAR